MKRIRQQTKISERTLRRILANLRGREAEEAVVTRKVGSGFSSPKVDDNITKLIKSKLRNCPTLKGCSTKYQIVINCM